MSGFLDGYEDVTARIKRFRLEFPTGRLEASVEDFDVQRGYILVKAMVFREYEDTVPSAVDFAFEMRSDRGVNRDFWVENCVTSAYGRVISALTPSEARPTRQDMEKVERLSAADIAARENLDVWNASAKAKEAGLPTLGTTIESIAGNLGGELVQEPEQCKHGHMILKEGISQKNGKAYHGYACPERLKANQCEAIWYDLNPAGKWVKREAKAWHK
jgi:hypothetical protein